MGAVRYNLRRGFLALRRSASIVLVDRHRGIDTATEVDLDRFGLQTAERVRYEPSGWTNLRRVLRPGDVGANDVFVDIGSGKGRVVLQAARYPCRRVVGVELAQELTAVARANLAASRDRMRCTDIELVTADALEYALPDDMTIAYLYNPFRGETFQRFLDGLIAAVDRRPRPLRLIYSTPMEHERVMASGRFRMVREARGFRPGRQWSRKLSIRMYELIPPGERPAAHAFHIRESR